MDRALSDYRPIGDYAVIGNTHTAALIASDGSVDWCCLPHFDSGALFCRLLDTEQGGCFRVGPVGEYRARRRYVDGTAILETEFETLNGRLRLTDFMHSQRIARLRQRFSVDGLVRAHGVVRGRIRPAVGPDRTRCRRTSRQPSPGLQPLGADRGRVDPVAYISGGDLTPIVGAARATPIPTKPSTWRAPTARNTLSTARALPKRSRPPITS
jgi:hypothetical protein